MTAGRKEAAEVEEEKEGGALGACVYHRKTPEVEFVKDRNP